MTKRSKSTGTVYIRGIDRTISSLRTRVRAPSHLCLYDRTKLVATITFLESIVSNFTDDPRLLLVDLSALKFMSAAAALVLFANVNYLNTLTGNPSFVTVIPPNERQSRKLFVESGLFAAIKRSSFDHPEDMLKFSNCFSTSCNPEAHSSMTAQFLRQNGVEREDIFGAINEAFLNVQHHAYESPAFQKIVASIGRRWWQYCFVKGSDISFILYDRGQGIPDGLRTFATGYVPDTELIRRAMQPGESRTMINGRGWGSEDIRKPIENVENGSNSLSQVTSPNLGRFLLVMSGLAHYLQLPNQSEGDVHHQQKPLAGTLIEWSLPLHSNRRPG